MLTLFLAILIILGAIALILSGAITVVLTFIVECWPLLLVIAIFMIWRKTKKSNNNRD